MRRHIFILTLLIVVVSAGLVVFFLKAHYTPAAASTQARPIDNLFTLLFSLGGVIFALCIVALIYAAIVFRRKPGNMAEGPPWLRHNWAEMLWTFIPLAIVLFLSVYGSIVLGNITGPPQHGPELEVKVSGSQWAWRFEYPEYNITSYELRLPIRRPVLFRLYSTDVIHSFWVPEFRIKQDAVPGMEMLLRVTPIRVGEYKASCAELCGLGHAYMVAPVRVVEPSAFDQWVKEQRR